jgi:hypothetical protein
LFLRFLSEAHSEYMFKSANSPYISQWKSSADLVSIFLVWFDHRCHHPRHPIPNICNKKYSHHLTRQNYSKRYLVAIYSMYFYLDFSTLSHQIKVKIL